MVTDNNAMAKEYCKYFESHLVSRFKAAGKGLTEKISSVQQQINAIDPNLVHKLKSVARVRNAVEHEHGFEVQRAYEFFVLCDEAAAALGLQPLAFQGHAKVTAPEKATLEVIPPSREIGLPISFPPKSSIRISQILFALAGAMLLVSLIGALFFEGFTTTVSVGFEIPRGFWPFDWVDHVAKSTDVHTAWYYLMWTSIWTFISATTLRVCEEVIKPGS